MATEDRQAPEHTDPGSRTPRHLPVEYLWWAECPSHEAGYALLTEALQAEGVAPEIVSIEMTSDEEAQRHQFIGSPTIRLAGADIDPAPAPTGASSSYALTCRAYRREDGRIAPLPTIDFLRAAIRRALEREGVAHRVEQTTDDTRA